MWTKLEVSSLYENADLDAFQPPTVLFLASSMLLEEGEGFTTFWGLITGLYTTRQYPAAFDSNLVQSKVAINMMLACLLYSICE